MGIDKSVAGRKMLGWSSSPPWRRFWIEAGISFGIRENVVESIEPINELEGQRDARTKRRAQVLDFSTYPLPFDQIGAITPCLWHRLPGDVGSKTPDRTAWKPGPRLSTTHQAGFFSPAGLQRYKGQYSPRFLFVHIRSNRQ
jgi:hypothetical protein